MREQMKGYVFYFDLIGVRARLLDRLTETIELLERFQRLVRDRSDLHHPGATLVTLADNVWARIPDAEPAAITSIVTRTVEAAAECGLDKYFGAVTFGTFDRDIGDAAITTGGSATDIRKQHIGMTSDPHLRAVMAEKWSAGLALEGKLPAPPRSIWIGEEVRLDLFGALTRGASFDLAALPIGGKAWPFGRSKFIAVCGA